VQAELDEELTGLVSYDNKAAIGDDLVKSINTQIIVQENLDSLSGLFVAAPDSAKKPSSEALLDRLQRQFQAIVAIFDEPFASRDLTTEGDIKTLYYRMEISHRNLLYLEQIKSDRLKVNLNHEECQVNSNLRSKTQALLVAQIQAHSEVINQSLADLGDALPAPDLAMDIDHFNNHLRLFLESFQALEF
jgi:multidrug efflux pump subunit AcrB